MCYTCRLQFFIRETYINLPQELASERLLSLFFLSSFYIKKDHPPGAAGRSSKKKIGWMVMIPRTPFPSFTLVLSRQTVGDIGMQERNGNVLVEPAIDLMASSTSLHVPSLTVPFP